MPVARYWAQYAWLGGAGSTRRGVLITVEDGLISEVAQPVAGPPEDARELRGLTLPGFANTHSHAFHRALRGRTQAGSGTFWTWRQRMYQLAGRLDPPAYQELAKATFAEMALAGITCVGEFHYLHHAPGGARYDDPNEMGQRLIDAAAQAGIRITLLDTLYLTATVGGAGLEGPQLRFSDGSLDAWSARVGELKPAPHAKIGAAAHSVRAVPAAVLPHFAQRVAGLPAQVHLSEQRAENEACLAVHGRTPAALLDEVGLTGRWLTAVHATHLSDDDVARLGGSGTGVCLCPTTERDLADGIPLARALANAGAPLSLGSDSHALIDPLEEARAVELNERLRDEHRGHFSADELLTAATATGHAALGWTGAGTLTPGARADLVTLRLDSVRTAGCAPDDPAVAAVFAATAADIQHVIVDGREVVRDGYHLLVGDVGAALSRAITAVWS